MTRTNGVLSEIKLMKVKLIYFVFKKLIRLIFIYNLSENLLPKNSISMISALQMVPQVGS
jgi:hypothetical protein